MLTSLMPKCTPALGLPPLPSPPLGLVGSDPTFVGSSSASSCPHNTGPSTLRIPGHMLSRYVASEPEEADWLLFYI